MRDRSHSEVFSRPGWLVLALGLLHLSLLQDPTTLAGKGFLLGHFGVVLLWQPLVSHERRFGWRDSSFILAFLLAMGLWLSWGLVLLWILLLCGLIGGKLFVYPSWRARLPFWLALLYLAMAAVGLVVPQIIRFVAQVPAMLPVFAAWSALPIGIAIFLLGAPVGRARGIVALDLAGSVVIILVLFGVLLGAVALMYVRHTEYLYALMQALLIVASQLLLLAWLWGPRAGFGGIGVSLMRKILSSDTRFEYWLEQVADLAVKEDSPEGLVKSALGLLAEWPLIKRLEWKVRKEDCAENALAAEGRLGEERGAITSLEHGAIRVEVHTAELLNATALWQLDIMIRILAEFHMARVQARRLQALSYLRAVHETGARVTHEVKNLLQSLDTLCFAISHADGRPPQDMQAMLQRQLPAISQRLHDALERIRQPQSEQLNYVAAPQWWVSLQERYGGVGVAFGSVGNLAGISLPASLFDLVADNLLHNALGKPDSAQIKVALEPEGKACALQVEDAGAAIPPDRAARLFVVPLDSDTGLGVGLYQAGRFAESAGYSLAVVENRDGAVRFRLSPRS